MCAICNAAKEVHYSQQQQPTHLAETRALVGGPRVNAVQAIHDLTTVQFSHRERQQEQCGSSVQCGKWAPVGMAVASGVVEQLEAQRVGAEREE